MGRTGLQTPKPKPSPAKGVTGHLKAHNGPGRAFFDGSGGPPSAHEPTGQMMRPSKVKSTSALTNLTKPIST
ncbi:unnamed protein product [Prunus armeniaca]